MTGFSFVNTMISYADSHKSERKTRVLHESDVRIIKFCRNENSSVIPFYILLVF
jgi:hypothetical protein